MILNIHQKIIISMTAVVFVLLMYDSLIHLLLGIGHIVFEIAEYLLDLVIDYFFEIGTHETQIIVFYILISVIFYSLYRCYRFLPRCYDKLRHNLYKQKSETLAQWRELSILLKIAWSSLFLMLINSWLFLM